MSDGASIRLDKIRFNYGETKMFFDLTIEASQIVAVMGPSGSGKSTLLNLIAGFEAPAQGQVFIDNIDVTRSCAARRPVSMIFQENNLFAHLDIMQNVSLGRSPALKLTMSDKTDILAAIRRTGLAGKEQRLPAALSGGERQRVALSRVLVRNRPVLLLDEPFASLGPALRREMLDLVRALHDEHKMTILMVTHHPDDARMFADEIAFVQDGSISALAHADKMFSTQAPADFRAYIGN